MKYLSPICFTALLLSGCATTTEYSQKVGGWIDRRVDDVRGIFSKPEQSETAKAASKLKPVPQSTTADKGDANPAKSVESTAPEPSEAAVLPENTKTVPCATRDKATGSSVVRSWTFDRDGCKAREEPYPQ